MGGKRTVLKVFFFGLLTAAQVRSDLASYRDLVMADSSSQPPSSGKVRLTYLGTNSYRFENGPHVLVVDPYFSRIGLGAFVFRGQAAPNLAEIEKGKDFFAGAEAILATHGHVDHLLDVPPIMQRTGAKLFASRTAVALATAAGATPERCHAVGPGDVREIGPWKISVLPATHDRVFLIGVPFPGAPNETTPPRRTSDWVCGEPLAFLIETAGKRIYLDSGGTPALLPPDNLGPIDLAILGVALPDARARLPDALRRLRPHFVLPSHQDNFFRPLGRGFAFAPMTNFPQLIRQAASEKLPGRLILLDYFRPWTMP
jgi:L-ascorbate metabolism protein UlaG (beta-lactamase superfamily)